MNLYSKRNPRLGMTIISMALLLNLLTLPGGSSFAQIGPSSSGSSFSTQTLNLQENDNFLHNTVNDQCCFERLDGTAVDRGLTPLMPALVDARAGFDETGVDFRGTNDPTHRACVNTSCFSIPEIPIGMDTQLGKGVPVGSSDTAFMLSLPSTLQQNEQIVATDGSSTSAPFAVDFSIKHNMDPVTGASLPVLNTRPEIGTGNRLNTIQFGFQQSGQSGVPGGSRGGPVNLLNGDSRDSGEASGCQFCGSQGERVARQQDFEIFFTIDSKTDANGNQLGNATGTFTQTLLMSDVLAPNDAVLCGTPACVGQMGPVTIQGSFTFDGTKVEIITEQIEVNGIPQTIGSADPLGVPTTQTLVIPSP